MTEDRRQRIERGRIVYCGGRGNPAPTLTIRIYETFGTIRDLSIFVKVGARSPRPHLVGLFQDIHVGPGTQAVKNKENYMANYNSNPGPGTNPGVKEKPMVSMLINSVHYFIDCVFILQTKDKFRLVALHQCRVICDKYYNTARGCRIAFDKMYKDKAWNEEIKAEWSHFYDPDKPWLEKKCSYLEN